VWCAWMPSRTRWCRGSEGSAIDARDGCFQPSSPISVMRACAGMR
jgi:hypothetical protein